MTHQEKAIVVIEATFKPNGMHTPEFKEYSRRSNANGEAHGGEVLKKFQVTKNLGNGGAPHMVLVIEYPSEQHARDTFTCSEYQAIVPLREVSFQEVKILLTAG